LAGYFGKFARPQCLKIKFDQTPQLDKPNKQDCRLARRDKRRIVDYSAQSTLALSISTTASNVLSSAQLMLGWHAAQAGKAACRIGITVASLNKRRD